MGDDTASDWITVRGPSSIQRAAGKEPGVRSAVPGSERRDPRFRRDHADPIASTIQPGI